MSDLESDMHKDARRSAAKQAPVSSADLLGTTDPEIWAREFCRIFDGKTVAGPGCDGSEAVSESDLLGWFSNAFQAKESSIGEDAADAPEERPYRFSEESLHELVFLCAGAATTALMRDSGLVMPAEEIIADVNHVLEEKGYPPSERSTVRPVVEEGGAA